MTYLTARVRLNAPFVLDPGSGEGDINAYLGGFRFGLFIVLVLVIGGIFYIANRRRRK